MDVEAEVIGPFRFIKPYSFVFTCRSKGRWYGKALVDVFTAEFKHWTRDQILSRIQSGDIKVNNEGISQDYVIKAHDIITHSIIRREAPIYNKSIKILGENDDYIAFLKPSSMPVHATGAYFYNSMIKQISQRYFPVHRLDRVTSGIIVMAKSSESSRRFADMLDQSSIKKTYIARVKGVFPPGNTVVNERIKETDEDRNKMKVDQGGKESLTEFTFIKTNGKESIVECRPKTGRTHQIRVHLSYLGFPISNDTIYGGQKADLTQQEKDALHEAERRGLYPPDTAVNPDEDELIFSIYLHSFQYSSQFFDFKAEMPEWADLEEA